MRGQIRRKAYLVLASRRDGIIIGDGDGMGSARQLPRRVCRHRHGNHCRLRRAGVNAVVQNRNLNARSARVNHATSRNKLVALAVRVGVQRHKRTGQSKINRNLLARAQRRIKSHRQENPAETLRICARRRAKAHGGVARANVQTEGGRRNLPCRRPHYRLKAVLRSSIPQDKVNLLKPLGNRIYIRRHGDGLLTRQGVAKGHIRSVGAEGNLAGAAERVIHRIQRDHLQAYRSRRQARLVVNRNAQIKTLTLDNILAQTRIGKADREIIVIANHNLMGARRQIQRPAVGQAAHRLGKRKEYRLVNLGRRVVQGMHLKDNPVYILINAQDIVGRVIGCTRRRLGNGKGVIRRLKRRPLNPHDKAGRNLKGSVNLQDHLGRNGITRLENLRIRASRRKGNAIIMRRNRYRIGRGRYLITPTPQKLRMTSGIGNQLNLYRLAALGRVVLIGIEPQRPLSLPRIKRRRTRRSQADHIGRSDLIGIQRILINQCAKFGKSEVCVMLRRNNPPQRERGGGARRKRRCRNNIQPHKIIERRRQVILGYHTRQARRPANRLRQDILNRHGVAGIHAIGRVVRHTPTRRQAQIAQGQRQSLINLGGIQIAKGNNLQGRRGQKRRNRQNTGLVGHTIKTVRPINPYRIIIRRSRAGIAHRQTNREAIRRRSRQLHHKIRPVAVLAALGKGAGLLVKGNRVVAGSDVNLITIRRDSPCRRRRRQRRRRRNRQHDIHLLGRLGNGVGVNSDGNILVVGRRLVEGQGLCGKGDLRACIGGRDGRGRSRVAGILRRNHQHHILGIQSVAMLANTNP